MVDALPKDFLGYARSVAHLERLKRFQKQIATRETMRSYSERIRADFLISCLAEDIDALNNVLTQGLDRDPVIDFNAFKMPWDFERFKLPSSMAKQVRRPQLDDFLYEIPEPKW